MAEPVKSQPARGSEFRLGGMVVALAVSLALILLFHVLVGLRF